MKTNSGDIGYTPFIILALLMALMFESSGFSHFINDLKGLLK
jgi:hypothetical protein